MQKIKKFYKNKENYAISLGALFALIGLSIPFAIFHLSKKEISLEAFQSLGAVGDFLGGSTVGFLSLASMLFVVAAIVMQKEELRLQRTELKLTREELAKTREEHALSNKTMKLQQFESTLFNMISIHGQLINDLKINKGSKNLVGREVIAYQYEKINVYYTSRQYHFFLKNYINAIRYDENSKEIIIEFLKRVKEVRVLKGYSTDGVSQTISSFESLPGVFIDNYDRAIDLHAEYSVMVELEKIYPEDELLKEFTLKFRNPAANEYKLKAFSENKEEENQLLSHYIKSIIAILNLIDSNDSISYHEKERYVSLFFSQFTIYEVTVVGYYAILDDLNILRDFMEKYNVTEKNEILPDAITQINN